jgi:hypothetical protein
MPGAATALGRHARRTLHLSWNRVGAAQPTVRASPLPARSAVDDRLRQRRLGAADRVR